MRAGTQTRKSILLGLIYITWIIIIFVFCGMFFISTTKLYHELVYECAWIVAYHNLLHFSKVFGMPAIAWWRNCREEQLWGESFPVFSLNCWNIKSIFIWNNFFRTSSTWHDWFRWSTKNISKSYFNVQDILIGIRSYFIFYYSIR